MPPLQDLQARYFDWCSARIAERILTLSPEELQSLGERLMEAGEAPSPAAGAGSSASSGVQALAEWAIRAVQADLRLPSFEAWVEEYRRDPERMERDLIGLHATPTPDPGSPAPPPGTHATHAPR